MHEREDIIDRLKNHDARTQGRGIESIQRNDVAKSSDDVVVFESPTRSCPASGRRMSYGLGTHIQRSPWCILHPIDMHISAIELNRVGTCRKHENVAIQECDTNFLRSFQEGEKLEGTQLACSVRQSLTGQKNALRMWLLGSGLIELTFCFMRCLE
jgi:hypothetical protein